jgi:translocation and assembly module TamA
MSADPVRVLVLTLMLLLAWATPAGAESPAAADIRDESIDEALRLEVAISGVDGDLLNNVRAALSVEQNRRRPGLSDERIQEAHALATGEIRLALQPFGYYRPEIDASLSPPAQPGLPWRASYGIDPGPALPIGALELGLDGAGEEDPKLAAMMEEAPVQVGATLNHLLYETMKRELVQQARELGYLDARLDIHRVEVDLEAYEARIALQLATGPLYVFGEIEFEQDRFYPEYLARYLVLQPGEPFSRARLARQRQLLSKSGHFQEVEIQPQQVVPGAQPAIPLKIVLQTYPANRYRGRLGWGTDTGFGIQLDWTRRHVGKRGQRFALGGAAVEERNRLAADLSYLIPLNPLAGSEIELAARHESKDLTYQDVELDQGGETRIATNLLSAFWHMPRRSWGSFLVDMTPGVSLVTENYDIFEVLFGNLPANAQDAIIDNIGPEAYDTLSPDFEALVPNLRLSLRRSDSTLFIRRGDYLQIDLLGASDALGSNISFWQARLYGWNIWPVYDSGRLLLRSALGYTEAESRTVLGVNFNQMPEYYEFRAGGARSVRGYAFESLFPSDSVTGGKHQAVASVEYEHEIIQDWSAAVFEDAGNAYNNFDDIDPKVGVGLGARWRSPVGLARIDLGFPLDDADDSFQIHITVGPEF